MESLVGAVNRNGQVRAGQYDIWYNITQIESPVGTLDYNASVAAWGYNSWSLPFEDEEGKQKREKEERNYQRLENLRTGTLASLVRRLQQNVSDLWKIYDNYIKPFEKTDDDYRKRLNAIYNDRTSGKDKWKNFWDSFGSISAAFIKSFVEAFAAAFVVAFAVTFLFTLSPWLVVGILVVLAVGCVVMVNVPEESVPNWLSGAKKAADAVANEAVKVLEYGPIVLVEDIGQGLMDQVQTPEGIAAVSGEVIGGIAGGIAGGITGKIAGGKVKAKINTKTPEVEKVPELEEPEVPNAKDIEAGKSKDLPPLEDGPYIKNGKPNGRPGPTGKEKLKFEQEVYNKQVDADGILRDPNTGEVIDWKPGEPRRGKVDFGHTEGNTYKKMFEKYKNREITLDELKEFQSNPDNFRLETPSSNRCHKYE